MRSPIQVLRRERRAGLSLDEVIESVAASVASLRGLDLLVFGSTVEHGWLIGDLDVWLAGAPQVIEQADALLRVFGQRASIAIDIASVRHTHPEYAPATRWCASRYGLVVTGSRPDIPPLSATDVEAAYRRAIEQRLRELVARADVLARAELPSAAGLVEAAVRTWVSMLATDRHEQRSLRREAIPGILRRLSDVDRSLAAALCAESWASRNVAEMLVERFPLARATAPRLPSGVNTRE